jgi:hypothetical protein
MQGVIWEGYEDHECCIFHHWTGEPHSRQHPPHVSVEKPCAFSSLVMFMSSSLLIFFCISVRFCRQLHRDPNVLFAGYKFPHPLQYKVIVRVGCKFIFVLFFSWVRLWSVVWCFVLWADPYRKPVLPNAGIYPGNQWSRQGAWEPEASFWGRFLVHSSIFSYFW